MQVDYSGRRLTPAPMLRAEGNLTYLQFVRLVETLWRESHPEIPFLAKGGKQNAVYPALLYSLQLRKTHPNEPKPKYREDMHTAPNEEAVLVSAQRFQNIVNFSIVTEADPRMAEELIEVFEDFMMEFTPVFKELGLSEITYARRLPDNEERREGEDVDWRTVCYLVTTEKVTHISVKKLEDIIIRARTGLVPAEFTGTYGTVPVFDATPTTTDNVTVELTDDYLTPTDG